MRGVSFLVLFALMAGAGPALAQSTDLGGGPVVEQKTPAVKKRAVRKPPPAAAPHQQAKPKTAAPKPAVAKTPAPTATPKPQQAKAAPVKKEPPQAKTAKAEPPKSEPTAFAGIPPAERLKIQSALYWSGDFANAGNGDDASAAAVRNFQKRSKAKITGVLTAEQRLALAAAAEQHEQEFGWSVVVDPATGIRIGLPSKLVPIAHDAAHGTRWTSPHGEVQVETFRFKNMSLAALFEREKKEPATRKIEHSALNGDNFVISGMQGLKLFTVRAQQRDGEVRGFIILYDQMMEGIVAPVMVAMASAYAPFPEQAAPFAALAKKVEYGTGLIVSAEGHIVTARKVAQGCQVIVADGLGHAERIAEDEANGLALLRVYGTRKLPALTFSREVPKAGDITLIGIPDPKEQDGLKKLTEIKARLTGPAAIELRQPVPMAGFAGAAALGGKGEFLGIMETRNFMLASAEPTLPPVRLIGAAAIRGFLDKHHVPLAPAPGADARAAAVRIICVRN